MQRPCLSEVEGLLEGAVTASSPPPPQKGAQVESEADANIADCAKEWLKIICSEDIGLSREYLHGVDLSRPPGVTGDCPYNCRGRRLLHAFSWEFAATEHMHCEKMELLANHGLIYWDKQRMDRQFREEMREGKMEVLEKMVAEFREQGRICFVKK